MLIMVILGSIIVPFLKIVVWFTLLDFWLITSKPSVSSEVETKGRVQSFNSLG